MTETQIKDYLKKYRIDSEESLAKHIEELKRNTKPNNEIIFPLVDLLLNEKSVLLSFFRENKKQEAVNPLFLDEMLEAPLGSFGRRGRVINYSTRHKAREEGKFHKGIVGDLEGINKPPKTLNGLQRYISELEQYKDDVITNSNRGEKETMEYLQGVKESQSVDKAPIFTYCKVNKNALEALSLRALYGHIKYKETDQDWQNFTRVPNALEEYANASFRHALGIGEEDEETHLVAEAWNAVAKLEVFLRNKLNKS